MRQLVYDPKISGKRMSIVCFISGSGTNYREIVNRNPDHDYVVFTNRPGCGGVALARANKHSVIELNHIPYLKEAKKKHGPGMLPRNCEERILYEKEVFRLIEKGLGREPDLICLAGYDQWLTDRTVERFYPRILNVHPGDTTKGYDGLHWIPAAKAILAGDNSLRSTLFVVDKGEDTGPVLVQSSPLEIVPTLKVLEVAGTAGLLKGLQQITEYAASGNIKTLAEFNQRANKEMAAKMEFICSMLQDALKVAGDWKIYPFAVHDLISQGRVEIDSRTIYVDGLKLPDYGYRLDEHHCSC
jgi:phosphoribosylglycinamide formyltransferase-1